MNSIINPIDLSTLVVAALYVVVILRIFFFFFPPFKISAARKISAFFGRYEWFVRSFRDYFLAPVLAALFCYFLYCGLFDAASRALFFVALSVFAQLRQVFHLRRMVTFAMANPTVSPSEFFSHYYAGFGLLPVKVPAKSQTQLNVLDVSFKSGKSPKISFWPVLAGVFNTLSLSALVNVAYKWKGASFALEFSRIVMVLWGLRALELGRLSLKVEGIEKINQLSGKFIFAFVHKSFLDFAVAPLMAFAVKPQNRPNTEPRFLAARDHFIDNKFLYLIMGRAMKIAGTIFVDRKRKTSSPREASFEASQRLAGGNVDIMIFPQGSRARKNVAQDGSRLDSSYYTSGKPDRLIKQGGHLKKGTAFIAVDTAFDLRMRELSAVHIVPVALFGSGKAVPSKSVKVETENEIIARVCEPITIKGSDLRQMQHGDAAYNEYVSKVHTKLDDSFKDKLETHALLEQRFFRDIRGLVPPSDYEHVSIAIKAWRVRDYFIYTLLDCIYACNPDKWSALLRELVYLMISDAPEASFNHFKQRVLDMMMEAR